MNNDKHIPYHATKSGNIYFSNLLNYYIIDYYKSKRLPLNGWFKKCINCDMITSNNIFLKYKNNKISIPVCKYCIKYSSKFIIDLKLSKFFFKYIDDDLDDIISL